MSTLRRTGTLARRGMTLTVACSRSCEVRLTSTLSTRKPVRLIKLQGATRKLSAATLAHIKLRLSARSVRSLRRALGRHRGLIARVQIVAVGATGKQRVLHRTYDLTR